ETAAPAAPRLGAAADAAALALVVRGRLARALAVDVQSVPLGEDRARACTHLAPCRWRLGSPHSPGLKQTVPAPPRIAKLILVCYCAVLSAIYVFALVNAPLSLLSAAGHDDGLFITIGRNLAAFQWLGPYNEFTLAKGPG